MARNRKRRSPRRPPRPADAGQARPGVVTARPQRERDDGDARETDARELHESDRELHETPSPIEHATPDVELAEAQLEQGRPHRAPEPEPELDADEIPSEPADSDADIEAGLEAEEELEDEDEFEDDVADAPRRRSRNGAEPAGELAPAPRALPGNRLAHFLQGSWRELQRVQWPDRRQTLQATGVVIGFVIVAGAFLGAADWVAGKIVHLILS